MRKHRIPLLLRFPKHIPHRHLQLLHHRFQSTQRDGLIHLFESEKRGRGEPRDLGKLSKRHLATGLLQEFGELLVEV